MEGGQAAEEVALGHQLLHPVVTIQGAVHQLQATLPDHVQVGVRLAGFEQGLALGHGHDAQVQRQVIGQGHFTARQFAQQGPAQQGLLIHR